MTFLSDWLFVYHGIKIEPAALLWAFYVLTCITLLLAGFCTAYSMGRRRGMREAIDALNGIIERMGGAGGGA